MIPGLRGYGEIVIAAILWGSTGIFVKLIDMSIPGMIFYRVLIATTALLLLFCFTRKLGEIKLMEKKLFILAFGFFQSATILSYFMAIKMTSVANAALLLYTAPIYVTLLSPFFLRERATGRGVLALLISMAGIILIVDPRRLGFGSDAYLLGVIFGILAGIFYAFQILDSRYISPIYPGYTQAFWGLTFTALVFFPAALGTPVSSVQNNLLLLILLGIFPTAISISLYFNGLKWVKASNASIVALLEPVSAASLSVLVLQEAISMTTLVGGALILTGALIASRE